MMRFCSVFFVLMLLISSAMLLAQAPAAAANRVIGVVTAADADALELKLKTDAGQIYTLSLSAETRCQRVAPGEKDLSKAEQIAPKEISTGDRVLARGTVEERQKTVKAQLVIVMSHSDLARKQEQEHADWQKRGVMGLVVSKDEKARQIVIRIPGMGEPRTLTVALADQAKLRRYAPDSVRFADAKPGSLAEISEGDQLRARGEKNTEGTRIEAEEVVTGAFRTLFGTVVEVDASGGAVSIKEADSGKTLRVRTTGDSTLRRLPQVPMGARGAGGPGRPGEGMMPPRGPGTGPPDFQRMIERLPHTQLSDLKPGEAVVVSSTRGAKADEITAITLLAGADFLLAMRHGGGPQRQEGMAPGGMFPGGPGMMGMGGMDMGMAPMP